MAVFNGRAPPEEARCVPDKPAPLSRRALLRESSPGVPCATKVHDVGERQWNKGRVRGVPPRSERTRSESRPPTSPIATASEARASAASGRSCAWAPLWFVGALIDSLHHASSWASWRALGGVSTAESFPLKGSRSFRLPRRQPPPRHLHQSRLYFQPPLSPKRAVVASGAWMSRLVPRSPPSRAGGPVLAFLHFVPRFCFTLQRQRTFFFGQKQTAFPVLISGTCFLCEVWARFGAPVCVCVCVKK